MTERGWWHAFFAGAYLDVHTQMIHEQNTSAQVDQIETWLTLAPPDRVLDVPCGEGRIAIELAKRGYRVTGADLSQSLLEDARRQTARRDLDVTWEHRDMRDLPWQEEFEAAVCYWGSFGYFDDEGNRAFVEAVAQALKPGGRFLIETLTVESLLPRLQTRDWDRIDDVLVLQERRFDHEQSQIVADWTFIRAEEQEHHRITIRLYTYRELCALLCDAGFERCDGYDPATGDAFTVPGSKRLAIVATKAT